MAARRLATLGSQLSGGAAASVAAEVDMAVEVDAASRVLIGGSISELDTPAMMVYHPTSHPSCACDPQDARWLRANDDRMRMR